MKTLTPNRNVRVFKPMWLPFGARFAGFVPMTGTACHGKALTVRRAGRPLTQSEIEGIHNETQRGGGRDGSVQPGLLGNPYRFGIS